MSLSFSNIAENFIANVAVFIIFGYLFVRLVDWAKRPKLAPISIREPNGNITINLRNNGRSAFLLNEVNWHLYLPSKVYNQEDVISRIKLPYTEFGFSKINGEDYIHLVDYNHFPLFPEREIMIMQLVSNQKNKEKFQIYYHFSTIRGLQPRWVRSKFFFARLQDKQGNPKFDLMPHINV